MAEKSKKLRGGRVSLKKNKNELSSIYTNKEERKDKNRVWIRKRVKTPFPTNYLPTIPLKMSAILRDYEFGKLSKKSEREQRKERDILSSKYSALVSYMETEIDEEREKLLKSRNKKKSMLLFKVDPKFDGILGKVVNYIKMQDDVKMITTNSNYDKIAGETPRLLIVTVSVE